MTRRKRKTVSFDAMVKFFIRNYEIPTKKDLDLLAKRLERIEKLIMAQPRTRKSAAAGNTPGGRVKGSAAVPASDTVYDVIKQSKNGVKFAEIQAQTGYEEKKLRNVIFRLHSTQRIKRISRGVYTAE